MIGSERTFATVGLHVNWSRKINLIWLLIRTEIKLRKNKSYFQWKSKEQKAETVQLIQTFAECNDFLALYIISYLYLPSYISDEDDYH